MAKVRAHREELKWSFRQCKKDCNNWQKKSNSEAILITAANCSDFRRKRNIHARCGFFLFSQFSPIKIKLFDLFSKLH